MHIFRTNRQFRALATSAFLSRIGSVLFNFVFLIYAQSLSFATAALSMVAIANMVPNFFTIPSGYLADRTSANRRLSMLLWLRVAQGLLYVVLALIIGNTASRVVFWVLLAINIASDVIADYTNGLVLHYEQHFLHTREEYQDAMGFTSGVGNIISIIFQAVGASLIVVLNHNYAIFGLINAASFVLAAAVLLQDRRHFQAADAAENDAAEKTPEPAAKAGKKSVLGGLMASMKVVLADRLILTMLLLAVLVNTLGTAIDGLSNVLLAQQHNLWFGSFSTTVAVIGIVSSVAMIGGSLLTHDGMQNFSLPTLTAITMFSLTLFAVNMFWWQNRYLMVAFMILVTYPVGKINPRLSSEIMIRVPASNLAATASVMQTCSLLGAPLGTVFFLGIANAINPQVAWVAYGVAAALITVLALVLARRERHLQAVKSAA
ncbi:MFS transporter [Lacticaseibacillus sharpeae]|uniref:Major facilitator superfamily permease n=2 Tax=Lacticaseibacillus sharpeae TaxID=1626 RepID=A0A0R1ZMJ4_9LACO|nr:MFS transporter [Lacticaseibacillus sharpeae]KRM55570.1 major facilitator superfamily permease [Lacticaseibacillus sharpeae JCM 1186 = DSM 20505]